MQRPASARPRQLQSTAIKPLQTSLPLEEDDDSTASQVVAKIRELEQDDEMLLLFKIGFPWFAVVTCALIGGGLLSCFVLSIVNEDHDVDTACNVTIAVPSFGLVTALQPQRFVWRVAVALHAAPRLITALVYWRYYRQHSRNNRAAVHYILLARGAVWLYMAENGCLLGMTYIASEENYVVHQLLFSTFIAASLLYQLVTIILFRSMNPTSDAMTIRSYNLKRASFLLNVLLTAAMLCFSILQHSFCTAGAYLSFILCQYAIFALIMVFHCSAVYEFSDHSWHVIIRRKFFL